MSQLPATEKAPSPALVFAAFAALYLIWGSTYLGILYAIQTIPPFLMLGSRFLIAGILLYAWCRMKGEVSPSLRSFWIISLGGILMLFVGNGAVTWSEQHLPSGLAAIIVATVPLWFVGLDKRQWTYHFSNKWIIIGLLTGFAGVLLLFSGKGAVDFSADPKKLLSFLVLIIGTIGWAAGSLYSKYKQVPGSTTMKAAIQMLSAGVLALVISVLAKEPARFQPDAVSATSLWALVYLIVMGSLVGYMSYIWLLSVRPPSLVGTYAYVNPVVAVFLGWAIAGEAISGPQVVALAVILLGVLVVNFAKKNTPKAEDGKEVSRQPPALKKRAPVQDKL